MLKEKNIYIQAMYLKHTEMVIDKYYEFSFSPLQYIPIYPQIILCCTFAETQVTIKIQKFSLFSAF